MTRVSLCEDVTSNAKATAKVLREMINDPVERVRERARSRLGETAACFGKEYTTPAWVLGPIVARDESMLFGGDEI